ncbi:hypothetical protein ABZX51_010398 [Aspergillus tubingensis]
MSDEPTILRPRPRRVFDLTPEEPSTPVEPSNPDLLAPKDTGSTSVSRNASIMNLTSSTLYGIYSPTAFDSSRDDSSPWGTEAHTPQSGSPRIQPEAPAPAPGKLQRTRSRLSHGLFRGIILPQALKSAFLLGFGVVYGVITIHLHENHWITPVKLENTHYYGSWQYLAFWGVAGVVLGNILPWFDQFSDEIIGSPKQAKGSSDPETADRTLSWVSVVRSVGAFVGIAFAMVSKNPATSVHWFNTNSALYLTAPTTLGIYNSSITDARAREPRTMVPHRPHTDRFRFVNRCWIGRYGYNIGTQA